VEGFELSSTLKMSFLIAINCNYSLFCCKNIICPSYQHTFSGLYNSISLERFHIFLNPSCCLLPYLIGELEYFLPPELACIVKSFLFSTH
jgi:hypothetical protein